MEFVLALVVLLAVVALFVTGPLRGREAGDETAVRRASERRAELEAAKEAKYREIRDAELDFRMGKLSEADFHATDRELRAQAIAILRRLDEFEEVEEPDELEGQDGPGRAQAPSSERGRR